MNKKIRYIAWVPILVIGTFCSAQTIHIDAVKKIEDDQFKKSQSILPIYKYINNAIEAYSKFGVEELGPPEIYNIKKMPNMEHCRDTGYTYIYFAGADNAEREGYILTMVGNYARSKRVIHFFVDRNNDLDFTNDGPPDSMTSYDNSIVLDLENINAPGATYSLKLTRFEYGVNVKYKNLLTDHYKKHSGNKVFTNINYCYREQRYNTITADYKSGNDSFRIAVKDMNVNGIYDESCNDQIYVGPYKEEVQSSNLFNIKPDLTNTAFEWNGKKYRFQAIESTGKYIELKEDPNAVLSNKLEVGKKTPDFRYVNIFDKQHKLSEFKKKQVYLFFWDLDNLSDEDTTYLGKIHREFHDKLKVITLNHGDEPKYVRIAYYYDKYSFPVGFSNSDIAKTYFLEDVNRGYYLDKRCKLINDRINPKSMYELYSTKRTDQ